MGTCPVGEEYDAGLCYPVCANNFSGVGPVCYGNCPNDFSDIGLFCEKPTAYGRGAGHATENGCLNSDDHGAATNGCERNGGLWYPKCDPAFHNFDCCICTPNCPTGYTDTGIGCTKPTYGRGVGSIPSLFSPGTITAIIVGFIIFIIIIVIIYFSMSGHKHHHSDQSSDNYNNNSYHSPQYHNPQYHSPHPRFKVNPKYITAAESAL